VTLAALVVALVAVAGGAAFAIVRGVALWRSFRGLMRATGGALEQLASRVDSLGAQDPPDTEHLAASVEQLQRSTAQLSLLLNALGRVRAQWSGLLAVYPRK
jgi:hypothetical protein